MDRDIREVQGSNFDFKLNFDDINDLESFRYCEDEDIVAFLFDLTFLETF